MTNKSNVLENKINVLDKGYVRLVDVMGSDLSVVNAARVSYDKESDELDDKDIRLLKFLARESHFSPFRHAFVTLEMYTPLQIARQHWKYITGSSHQQDMFAATNESSRRYVTEEPEFYLPSENEWRSYPENVKQGSGEPLDSFQGAALTQQLLEMYETGERLYNEAMGKGVAPEQARLFLPAYGLYVRYRWSASLQSVAHMLNQRLANDSQYEFQQYAKAVYDLVEPHFTHSFSELVNVNNG